MGIDIGAIFMRNDIFPNPYICYLVKTGKLLKATQVNTLEAILQVFTRIL